GPLGVERAVNFVCQAALGLQHAHERGLVHGDIRPANLVVSRKGVVKILDMGLALFFGDQDGVTRRYGDLDAADGAGYMAPEQILHGNNAADGRADIYGLGATLYFLLAGRGPFADTEDTQKLARHLAQSPQPIQKVRPEVPEALATVLTHMLARDLA